MPTVLGLQPPTLLQAVLDDVGVALAVIDREGKIIFHNQAARDMFGAAQNLSGAEWRHRNYKVHDIQGREIPQEQGPLVRALAGEEVKQAPVRVTLPDGRTKWLHVAANPFSVLGLAGVFVIVTDETEQIELRKAIERLQRSAALDVLAGGLAHDFNNILTVLTNNIALALSDEGVQEITNERLQEMAVAVKRGAAMVRRLMEYSRQQDDEMRPVQVNRVVDSVLSLVRPVIRGRVRVRTQMSHQLPDVQGDSSRLEQVLVNLILNALDAMPEGGELALGTDLISSDLVSDNKADGQFVVITVSDTGIGIPEHVQRNIFTPFFTTKAHGKGTGLGLSSAQTIVRQHGGRIELQSAPGAGTTFRIFLPAQNGSVRATATPEVMAEPSRQIS
jgi:two-component system, cell cycle sensor histidine kinase and response regulator CckA